MESTGKDERWFDNKYDKATEERQRKHCYSLDETKMNIGTKKKKNQKTILQENIMKIEGTYK